jgi:uncharacterized membrane protein YebE (DUF533 family)
LRRRKKKLGSNGRFTDGLLLGALIGGAAVFLLGTKKGNKVLKVITEEGLAGFSSLVEEYEDHRNGVTPEPAPVKSKKAEVVEEEIDDIEMVLNQAAKVEKEEAEEGHKKPAKRFFKKAK